jgi:hypothetical protein
MSEIALQDLLNRTIADEQDYQALDMTVVDGTRMGKNDIRALKLGRKVASQMQDSPKAFGVQQFNNFLDEVINNN